MKFVVIQDKCISCGLCESICPDVFTMNEEGKAVAYNEATGEVVTTAEEAMASCPTEAIEKE
ncbi:MAG TPA: ferredoxin [Clostridia bacterium]|jgi:ferredoxin|nr:ferredoxin [Clostridia bacterium]